MSTVESCPQIEGVHLVRFRSFGDSRGYFYESFRRTWVPGSREMIQGNCSFSRAGVLRGMHYHHKQADFWGVPAGNALAALYDFRETSRTRGATMLVEMGRNNPVGLYIPKGVAHGFYAREDAYMTYLVDEYYDGGDEMGIRWNDPALGIDWGVAAPVLSQRDAGNPFIAAIDPAMRPR